MVVACDHCGARYKLDPSKISGRGAKITCPRCAHVFVVYRDGQTGGEGEPSNGDRTRDSGLIPVSRSAKVAPAGLAAPPPTRSTPESRPNLDANNLDYRLVGIQSWKVKVKIGLVYDFSDFKTLNKYIQDGRVTSTDLLSHDGAQWVSIGDIPDLEQHFVNTYLRLERAQADREAEEAEAGAAGFDDDQPTNIVGMDAVEDAIQDGPSAPASPPPPARPAAASHTGGAAGPDAAHRFVDPFDAMKERQRGQRSKTRRPAKGGPGPTAAPPRAKEAAKNGGNAGAKKKSGDKKGGFAPLVLGAAVVVLGIAWWVGKNNDSAEASNPPPRASAAPVTSGTEATAAKAKAPTDSLVSKLEQQLEQIEDGAYEKEADLIEDEPIMIAVVPSDAGRGAAPGKLAAGSGVSLPAGGSVSTSSLSARDYAAEGENAMRRLEYSTAARAYADALRLEPGNATYHEGYGAALYRSGDLSGASGALATAVRGGATRANKWLGYIAEDQGDVAGAIGYYDTYLKTVPGDSEVRARVDHLRSN